MSRMGWRRSVGALVCGLALTLPGMGQGGPGGAQGPGGGGGRPQRPGGGTRPSRPGAGQGSRPGPQPGRPGPQPGRPGGSAAGGGRPPVSRPQPGGPGSGGGRPPGGGGRPPGGGGPQPGRPGGRPGGRPPQWGRPPQNRPSYQFRPNDRGALHRYYRSHLGYINRSRRPIFRIGEYFPYGDIGYLSPLPPSLYGQMRPPPYGYQMGYFDGYVVVYDPLTYFIANLVDLLQ